MNAADYVVFNKSPYALHNSVNSFTWWCDDSIYMYDLNGNTLSNKIVPSDSDCMGQKL